MATNGANGNEWTAVAKQYYALFEYLDSTTVELKKKFLIEILPTAPSTLVIWQHVRKLGVTALIEVQISLQNAISNQNLYIEFPTKIDSETVFADDLGTGLGTGEQMTCDFQTTSDQNTKLCYLDTGSNA